MQSARQSVVPALRVKSYEDSRRFYERLGFAEDWTHLFGPGFPVFASISRHGQTIFLTEHTGDCAFGGLVHFYLPDMDVDAYYAACLAAGVEVDQAPGNNLGEEMRDMVILDPDGNRLVFITHAPD
ncbi:glyoxalase superfamily protein [Luteimonas aquatica]|uniref:glyoxalase superfamily protein n=1 Tax=Luteimonas aquatica TaxID=450364 RepID=UPI001F58D20A|nr:glyoxalase superfamily protein [Luteimonas aquatica]